MLSLADMYLITTLLQYMLNHKEGLAAKRVIESNDFHRNMEKNIKLTSSTLAAVLADVSIKTRPCSLANASPCYRKGRQNRWVQEFIHTF